MIFTTESRVLILLFKIMVAGAILVLTLMPANVYHCNNLVEKRRSFNVTFSPITLTANHHFCLPPKAEPVDVKNDEILMELNLPEGTTINENLREFGSCRAKMKKLKMDPSLCNCGQKFFDLIVLIVMAGLFVIINGVHIFEGPLGQNRFCSQLAYIGSLTSYSTFLALNIYEWFVFDTVLLPGASEPQSYFSRVIQYLIALILLFVYSLLQFVEHRAFLPDKTRANEADVVPPQQFSTVSENESFVLETDNFGLTIEEKSQTGGINKLTSGRQLKRYTYSSVWAHSWP